MKIIDFFNINEFKLYKFKKNDVIKNEFEECDSIGYILKGEINIFTSLIDDDKYMITTLHETDLFGESLIFSSKPFYLGTVIATKETNIMFFSKKVIMDKLRTDSLFLDFYLTLISNKSLQIQNRCKVLSQKNIQSKILFHLITEAKNTKSIVITIKSKEELASLLNIPRPSLSRELINLKNNGIIDYGKKFITLKKYNIK